MDTIKTFLIEIVCPKCGKSGTAHASSRDEVEISLDQIPFGFSQAEAASDTSGPQVKCQCGHQFEVKHELA